jgi:hypothetical protein
MTYEDRVRDIAATLDVFGGRDGAVAGSVIDMAREDNVPFEDLESWMKDLKENVARGHFMNHVH